MLNRNHERLAAVVSRGADLCSQGIFTVYDQKWTVTIRTCICRGQPQPHQVMESDLKRHKNPN